MSILSTLRRAVFGQPRHAALRPTPIPTPAEVYRAAAGNDGPARRQDPKPAEPAQPAGPLQVSLAIWSADQWATAAPSDARPFPDGVTEAVEILDGGSHAGWAWEEDTPNGPYWSLDTSRQSELRGWPTLSAAVHAYVSGGWDHRNDNAAGVIVRYDPGDEQTITPTGVDPLPVGQEFGPVTGVHRTAYPRERHTAGGWCTRCATRSGHDEDCEQEEAQEPMSECQICSGSGCVNCDFRGLWQSMPYRIDPWTLDLPELADRTPVPGIDGLPDIPDRVDPVIIAACTTAALVTPHRLNAGGWCGNCRGRFCASERCEQVWASVTWAICPGCKSYPQGEDWRYCRLCWQGGTPLREPAPALRKPGRSRVQLETDADIPASGQDIDDLWDAVGTDTQLLKR